MSPHAPRDFRGSGEAARPVREPDPGTSQGNAFLVPGLFGRLYLWIELVLLYLGIPVLLYTQRQMLEDWLMLILVGLGAGCAVLLWYDSSFEEGRLWKRDAFQRHLSRILWWFLFGAVVVGGAFGLLRPDLLLTFPRSQTEMWLALLVTYPLLSVYPQEIIFRAFFFHRYRFLFPTRWGKIAASGLTFGFAHIVFANWVAPIMTAVIGVQFALTYARTGSTLQVTIEHGLWGVYAFTLGLGWFVHSGAI